MIFLQNLKNAREIRKVIKMIHFWRTEQSYLRLTPFSIHRCAIHFSSEAVNNFNHRRVSPPRVSASPALSAFPCFVSKAINNFNALTCQNSKIPRENRKAFNTIKVFNSGNRELADRPS